MNKQVVNLFTKCRRSECHEIKRFYLRLAVWLFVETLVRPHVQDHAAALTLEALFVPYLEQKLHSEITVFPPPTNIDVIDVLSKRYDSCFEKKFFHTFVSFAHFTHAQEEGTLNRDLTPGKQKAFNRGDAFVSLLLIGSI